MEPPVFGNKTNLKNNVKELSEGQYFTLHCDVSGMPPPQIKWLKGKNPVKLNSAMDILDNGKKLRFTHLSLEDDGKYTCVATNRGGTVQQSITLSLLGKHSYLFISSLKCVCLSPFNFIRQFHFRQTKSECGSGSRSINFSCALTCCNNIPLCSGSARTGSYITVLTQWYLLRSISLTFFSLCTETSSAPYKRWAYAL